MIKKAILFVLLLGAGFLSLHLAVGSETEAALKPANNKGRRSTSSGPGVRFGDKDKKDPLTLVPGGEIDFPRMREVALSGGRTKQYPLYKLHAEDSRADADNRLILERVTVDFYELQRTPGDGEPMAVKSSTMTARSAKLQLSQDRNAVARIAEDKKMEFRGVVFEIGKEGGAEVTRITLDHALALNTAEAVHLWTPDPEEPVEILTQSRADGANILRVSGLGLDAWMPTVRDKKGDLRVRESGIGQLTVKKNPVLAKDGTILRSRGPLEYMELAEAGAARVTMVDQVEIQGLVPSGGAEELIATGDHLEAVMIRGGGRTARDMVWNRITLTGQPVSLREGEKMELLCEQFDVRPGIDGSPFWFTAESLDPASHPKMRQKVDGTTTTFEAGSKVHLIQIAAQHASLLKYFGVPAGHIAKEFRQLILFEGSSRVDSPEEHMTLRASRGLAMLRGGDRSDGGYLVMKGRGAISIASDDLRIRGSDGFFLEQLPADQENPSPRRSIRLGPLTPDPEHRFVILREGGDRAFRIEGSGDCRLDMNASQESTIHLASPAQDIVAHFSHAKGKLSQVETLKASFTSESGLSSFNAIGRLCLIEFETKDGKVTGEAQQVMGPRPEFYNLLGNLAKINYGSEGQIRGRQIIIHRFSTRDIMVKALGDAGIDTHGLVIGGGEKGSKPGTVDLRLAADELRALPFLVPPTVASYVFQRVHPVVGLLGNHSMQSRHLFARGHVNLTITQRRGDESKTGHGHGDELTLRVSADRDTFTDGELIGDPAIFKSVDLKGRRTTAKARVINFYQEQKDGQGQESVVLHPVGDFYPELTIMGPQTNRSMICEGLVRVEPRVIRFLGPVTVVSLGPDGQVDPRGMFVKADGMVMNRDRQGNVTSVLASGNIKFSWDEIRGVADELSIDLVRTLLIARGIYERVRIELPGGPVTVAQLNYNYRTKMHTTWKFCYQQVTSYK